MSRPIPLWETHWFQLDNLFLLELEKGLLKKLVSDGIEKAGNLSRLCNKLGLSAPTFYNFINNKKNIQMISVLKLKKLLQYLGVEFSSINNHIVNTRKGKVISIEKPKFPIDLNTPEGAYLLGLIVSDGCIYFDKKARNRVRTKYAAGEEDSEKNFRQIINHIYGKVHIQREFIRNCAILRIGSSIVGDTLLKVGALSGHKATNDGDVPWLIKNGTKEIKANYLRAVFDDESCVYVPKERKFGYITLSRYRHLNDLTTEQEEELHKIESLMSVRKFPTGHLNKTIPIRKALEHIKNEQLIQELKKAPKLTLGESALLDEMGIEHRLFGRCLTKTNSGKYSLCFDLFINKKNSLKKFYKEIGFSLGRKQHKLCELIGADKDKTV